MIIFNLDGTLADCDHRRHFVEKNHPTNLLDIQLSDKDQIIIKRDGYFEIMNRIDHPDWQPDWKAFYNECDQDAPIHQTLRIFKTLYLHTNIPIQILSGRCESTREKTLEWFEKTVYSIFRSKLNEILKMRPIGDNTPEHELKERWLDEHFAGGGKPIEFVFDSDPQSIAMWRRRGIFVFNCNQNDMVF